MKTTIFNPKDDLMRTIQPSHTAAKAFGLLALITLIAYSQAPAAEKQLPTISVAATHATGVLNWQPAMGEGLAQMLITELNNLPNFKVLESVALDDLREERKLGESLEVSEAESVKKGQWKGADYTFKSTITRFGGKENNYGGHGWTPHLPFVSGGGSGISFRKTEHEVQIDWRIIDNATREIVASGRGTGKQKGGGFNFSSWSGGGFSDNREFLDSGLGKATMKAIEEIVAKVKMLNVAPGARAVNNAAAAAAIRNVKGTVLGVDGREIWVSLGTTKGFAVGDKIRIYEPVQKKNKKGEVFAVTYKSAGDITLSKVQKDKSMGLYDGTASVNEDWAAADAGLDIEKLN